jgi:photosystem II stability/assembly factor-like uncharacterized protein
LLVTLGLSVAACTANSTPAKARSAPPVLGQRSGTPAAVGQPAPAGTGQLGAVACAGLGHCWAVGTPGQPAPTPTPTTTPASTPAPGATTTTSAPPAPPAPATVIDATVNGGKTWAAQPLALAPAPVLTGISCPTIELCMAVGLSGSGAEGIVVATHRGGADWGQVASPAGATVITSVQCASAVDCIAIASDGTSYWSANSDDFGHTWARGGTLPAGLQDAGALACVAGGPCLVTGFTPATSGHGQGAIALSADRGATWAAATVPAGTGLLQGAVCATVTSCLAAGSTSTTVSAVVPAKGALLTSQDGGQTWVPSPTRPPTDDVFGLACPSNLICAMVGTKWSGHPAVGTGAVAQSHDGGLSFSASKTAYTPLTLTALACFSTRACVAVGGDTVARLMLARVKPHHPSSSTTSVGDAPRPGSSRTR